ncbi:MAG: cell division protein FtsL [Sulfuritalea sp.]|nr:cell division protein FtsL [Sulfuritalea sp.]MDP1985424.1 cell division protein FtsL [Sulfuritalea sp.]
MARLNFILVLILLACALSLVSANHRARKLFTELESVQKRMRDLDVEWGKLQLEQSTVAAHIRVEKVAREKLGMKQPAPGQIISVDGGAGH